MNRTIRTHLNSLKDAYRRECIASVEALGMDRDEASIWHEENASKIFRRIASLIGPDEARMEVGL